MERAWAVGTRALQGRLALKMSEASGTESVVTDTQSVPPR